MANDLILNPDYTFETTTKWKTGISEFENGVEQRRPIWGSKLREWKLIYKNRDSSDLGTIQTLFDNKKGSALSFTWTNPLDSATYTVRFKEDSLSYVCGTYGLYNIEFSLIEVK